MIQKGSKLKIEEAMKEIRLCVQGIQIETKEELQIAGQMLQCADIVDSLLNQIDKPKEEKKTEVK